MADIPHYCDIFDNCARCPVPFCPYEKRNQEIPEEQEEPDVMDGDDGDDGW